MTVPALSARTTTPLVSAAQEATSTTPFLLMDLDAVTRRIDRFRQLLPGVGIHYAMKCNPEPQLLHRVAANGASFEIASLDELRTLQRIGIDTAPVIFSNPIKLADHIRGSFQAGIRRFAFDSLSELDKLAEYAPSASVYVRLRPLAPDGAAGSVVPSEGKFGVELEQAAELMVHARSLGLDPSGIGFHVGSQMLDPGAWVAAIAHSATLMRRLAAAGIQITMLDLGGGFPAHYDGEEEPDLEAITTAIRTALDQHLPHPVPDIVIEPGRSLVAEAGIMVATVIGTATRNGVRWLHLDIGAFNGMMEALETANTLRFPMTDSLTSAHTSRYHVTGPTCDSQDTLLHGVELSADLHVGDRLYIHTAGAYTTCYASTFNGFAIPETYCF